jgi:hypothetical protein
MKVRQFYRFTSRCASARLHPAPPSAHLPRPPRPGPFRVHVSTAQSPAPTGVSLPFSSPNPAADSTLPDLRRPSPSASSGGRQHPPRFVSPSPICVALPPHGPTLASLPRHRPKIDLAVVIREGRRLGSPTPPSGSSLPLVPFGTRYGTANTSRDAYLELTGLLDSVGQSLFVLLVFIKTNPQMIWEPALMLYVTIWFGSDCESLSSTFSAPLLGELGFCCLFHYLAFCFIPLCSLFSLSSSGHRCSTLVNCWTPIQHGKDQYNEPY